MSEPAICIYIPLCWFSFLYLLIAQAGKHTPLDRVHCAVCAAGNQKQTTFSSTVDCVILPYVLEAAWTAFTDTTMKKRWKKSCRQYKEESPYCVPVIWWSAWVAVYMYFVVYVYWMLWRIVFPVQVRTYSVSGDAIVSSVYVVQFLYLDVAVIYVIERGRAYNNNQSFVTNNLNTGC